MTPWRQTPNHLKTPATEQSNGLATTPYIIDATAVCADRAVGKPSAQHTRPSRAHSWASVSEREQWLVASQVSAAAHSSKSDSAAQDADGDGVEARPGYGPKQPASAAKHTALTKPREGDTLIFEKG